MPALSSACKTDQADFTYWMSFLQFNLMEEISPTTESLSVNSFHQHGNAEKTMI